MTLVTSLDDNVGPEFSKFFKMILRRRRNDPPYSRMFADNVNWDMCMNLQKKWCNFLFCTQNLQEKNRSFHIAKLLLNYVVRQHRLHKWNAIELNFDQIKVYRGCTCNAYCWRIVCYHKKTIQIVNVRLWMQAFCERVNVNWFTKENRR